MLAAPLGRGEADDHARLLTVGFDLQPVAAAPSRRIDRAQLLGHHPLLALGPGGLEEKNAIAAAKGLQQPHRGAIEEAGLHQTAPLAERNIEKRITVVVEQVENVEEDGDGRVRLGPGPAALPAGALLEAAETGQPVL